jgi:predicted lactoylglutathione lyase
MQFLSLQPFVPSGKDFEKAKAFFSALGFSITWSNTDYAGFENNTCKFILQRFDNTTFAENFMITVGISNAQEFSNNIIEKRLPEQFGIRISEVMQQHYGKEVNIIDMAGVCWHFVE